MMSAPTFHAYLQALLTQLPRHSSSSASSSRLSGTSWGADLYAAVGEVGGEQAGMEMGMEMEKALKVVDVDMKLLKTELPSMYDFPLSLFSTSSTRSSFSIPSTINPHVPFPLSPLLLSFLFSAFCFPKVKSSKFKNKNQNAQKLNAKNSRYIKKTYANQTTPTYTALHHLLHISLAITQHSTNPPSSPTDPSPSASTSAVLTSAQFATVRRLLGLFKTELHRLEAATELESARYVVLQRKLAEEIRARAREREVRMEEDGEGERWERAVRARANGRAKLAEKERHKGREDWVWEWVW